MHDVFKQSSKWTRVLLVSIGQRMMWPWSWLRLYFSMMSSRNIAHKGPKYRWSWWDLSSMYALLVSPSLPCWLVCAGELGLPTAAVCSVHQQWGVWDTTCHGCKEHSKICWNHISTCSLIEFAVFIYCLIAQEAYKRICSEVEGKDGTV